METLEIIIKIISLAFFFSHTEEFFDEINLIAEKKKNIIKIPGKILKCIKCNSFWLTLIFSQDFFLATQISLLAYLLDKYLLNKTFTL